MKPLRMLSLALLLGLFWSSPSHGVQVEFSIELDGAQAMAGKGTGSTATGSGWAMLDTETRQLEWLISFEDAAFDAGSESVTVAHFHRGIAGTGGPPITPPGNLGIENGTLQGSASLDANAPVDFLTGRIYINIHSTSFPAGEIRGQVIPKRAILEARKDNTLYESDSGNRSNGAGQHFFVGRNMGGLRKRGLLYFDITEAQLPMGTTVTHASLDVRLSRTNAGPHDINLHRVLADWGEGRSNAAGSGGRGSASQSGDATWLHSFFSTELWTTPGGDFMALPSGSLSVGGPGAYTWESTGEMVQDVQAWLDDPQSNFGWLLFGDESRSGTAKRFDTHEHPNPQNRPRLTIEYRLPCPYLLTGDLNGDCKVDFLDLALLLDNWQIDCSQFPLHPACVIP